MPQEHNYWLTTVQMPVPPEEPLPESADVAVIGAGFTGLSAALALAKRGAKVAVLESETIGWGASSRNGGMVLTGLKLGVNKLISTYGSELARRMYAASLETISCVERIVKEENIACDFARTGHLEVACKQAHFDDHARQVEVIAREFNHQLRIVPRHELRSEIGSDIYFGGMVDEISVGVNPARYVAGLGAAVMRAGARICEHTRLLNIGREARNGAFGFKLNTSRGSIWARDVLVGTSGYTGGATPALRNKIIHASRRADGWHLLCCRIRWARCCYGELAGSENGAVDRGREDGQSVCGDSVPRRAARALQRQAVVPAIGGRVL